MSNSVIFDWWLVEVAWPHNEFLRQNERKIKNYYTVHKLCNIICEYMWNEKRGCKYSRDGN